MLDDLRQTLGDQAFTTQIDRAARRIADLETLLECPDAAENPNVSEAVHDLVGVAGMIGLTDLAANLRWFDTADDRTAPAAALLEAAVATRAALRRHRGLAA